MDSHKGAAAAAAGGGGGGSTWSTSSAAAAGRTTRTSSGSTTSTAPASASAMSRVGCPSCAARTCRTTTRGPTTRGPEGRRPHHDLIKPRKEQPNSPNEYVLKGCDVQGTPPPPCSQAPKRTRSLGGAGEKKRKEEEEEAEELRTPCNDDRSRPVEVVLTPCSDESSPKSPPPPLADHDSPGGCESARRSTAVPFKVDKPQGGLADEQKQQQHEQVVIKIKVSRSQNRQRQKHEEKEEEEEDDDEEEKEAGTEKADDTKAVEEEQQPAAAAAGGVRSHAHAHAQAVGKQQQAARTMRVARAFHNMLTCGGADADDAALRPLARRQDGGDDVPTPTCPGMEGCGLRVSSKKTARPRNGGNDTRRKRDGEKKHDAHKHKPASLPRCSQCGKEFKPQELHSHMQSCRGFRERMRSSTSARPSADRRRNRTAGHYSSESERPSSVSAVFLLLTES